MKVLPPLREVINTHDLVPKKSLGQNFLMDPRICENIAKQAKDLAGTNVVEVGGGPGGLTRALLKTNAKSVTTVDFDKRAISALTELSQFDERLSVIHADALDLDLSKVANSPRVIVANLPYNIATPLLFGWLRQIDKWKSLTLMFQKEVAKRITAAPNTKEYGRLSILSQLLCDIKTVVKLSPNSFVPPPKVYSHVLHFIPKQNLSDFEFCSIETIAKKAFSQRRKMIRTTLCEYLPILKAIGIDETLRAESLSPQQYADIAKHFAKYKQGAEQSEL